MRASKAIWLLSVLATLLLSIPAAQVSPADSPAKGPHAVTVTFFVDDNRGNPVSNLQLSDLSVLDDGKPPLRLVSFGTAKELPLRLRILLDTNPGRGVYYSKKQLEYEAAPKWAFDFVEEVLTGPDDKAFIASYSTIRHGTTFAMRDQLKPIDLNQFLKTDVSDFLGTRDAIRIASKEVFGDDPAGQERRVLIVTPGADEQAGRSLSDYPQTIVAAQRAGVKVFIWGCCPWSDPSRRSAGMSALVAETGGSDLSSQLWHTKSQIDSMYRLSYIPAEPYQPGKLRRLDLKIKTDKKWRVYAPKRYLVPSTQ
jgi:hypothetical protein